MGARERLSVFVNQIILDDEQSLPLNVFDVNLNFICKHTLTTHTPQMEELPTEMTALILSFASPHSHFLLAMVCQEWNAILLHFRKRCGQCKYLTWSGMFVSTIQRLQWACDNGYVWDARTCKFAAAGGHLEVLKWARVDGCAWDIHTCMYAAYGGHLELLKWARENSCEWDEWMCALAARHGHLEVLKWARENSCEWDEYTCASAAGGGHLDVLKWARENDCP